MARDSSSVKAKVKSIYCPLIPKKRFNVCLNRWARLESHARHEYLFRINCRSSPLCHCGTDIESIEHYFLHCPRFAVQRASLFTSAERICGHMWLASTNQNKVFYSLNNFDNVNYEINVFEKSKFSFYKSFLSCIRVL